MRRALALIGAAAVLGLLAGVLLEVATFLMARYGPQAGHWSFRGNGALAVPAELGPVVLAGAWMALVLRYRRFPTWWRRGIATLLVGIGYLAVTMVVLFATGLDLMIFIILLIIVAPVVSWRVRAPAGQARPGSLFGHLGAAVAFAVAMVVAFLATGMVLPAGG
jgi:hypothetical protein